MWESKSQGPISFIPYNVNLLSKFHRFLSAEFQILNSCKILPVGIIEILVRKIQSLNYLNFADLVHVQLPSNKALNSVKISFVVFNTEYYTTVKNLNNYMLIEFK